MPKARLYAQRGLEQHPGAPVEELEKAAVEDDARGVAMAPLDGKPPSVYEFRHDRMIAVKRRGGQSRLRAKKAPKIMTGELAPARHVPCAATRSRETMIQTGHLMRRW